MNGTVRSNEIQLGVYSVPVKDEAGFPWDRLTVNRGENSNEKRNNQRSAAQGRSHAGYREAGPTDRTKLATHESNPNESRLLIGLLASQVGVYREIQHCVSLLGRVIEWGIRIVRAAGLPPADRNLSRTVRRALLPKQSSLSAVTALIVVALGQPQSTVDFPHPADQFAVVGGLKLQYVDWGGRGEVLLFLPGLGASAHHFDSFAPRFTGNFHVLGLTRRGQGLSDKPSAGYDTATLAEDINGFLNVMRIQRVNLIAHSIGGMEMTRFAVVHPSRAAKLVYLDAAYGLEGFQLMADAGIPYPPYRSDAERQINTSQSTPDFAGVKAPVLSFFVVPDIGYAAQPDNVLCPGCSPDVAANVKRFWQLMEDKNFWSTQIDRFRREAKQARVVVLHGTNHMFFLDPKQIDAAVTTIKDFLMER